ncbi:MULTISPECIES: AAA family ATPase [Methylorubrum]|uniref:AAA family ATPase n=1 Tax=Methylorubrum TaxID=2282523 RepID=UPI0034602F36|nr:putative ATP-binding protein involved in virulence [Methylorubrum zatmanii]MCP1553162.1 putative ATP-binding protein involved in virulence [Methylorubrum extorquens]MCP1580526.1 putative ATP-binding protein involved in virulence [Methylorubrum extorquens]
MIINRLVLRDFRGFSRETIDFDERLTVLVGANGAGKTSVLDAISILLDQYSARLLYARATARRLSDGDTRINAPETRITLEVTEDCKTYRWTLAKQGSRERILKPKSSEFEDLNQLVRHIADSAESEQYYLTDVSLPVYYDQRRALADIPKRKSGSAKHGARDAFSESRERSGLDFRGFTYWFQERESEELRRQRRDATYRDPQLETVRRSIEAATGLSELGYRTIPPRGLTIRKGETELHIEQLSTGERTFLSIAGDLARRLAMISSEGNESRLGRAIVLIDEVELHLHPRWQRKVMPWLLGAFPNCQFIVTTHSPQVVGEISAQHLRVLSFSSRGSRVGQVAATRGRDSNFILASALGAEERSAAARSALKAVEEALARDNVQQAQAALEAAAIVIEGSAPELAIAEARIQRRAKRAQ